MSSGGTCHYHRRYRCECAEPAPAGPERPIQFGDQMAWAIRNDRKTVTRRPVKPGQDCPRWMAKDRLWVKETWATIRETYDVNDPFMVVGDVQDLKGARPTYDQGYASDRIQYRADPWHGHTVKERGFKWRGPRFMPRWAARFVLEVEDVRRERLLDITEEGAWAEGFDDRDDFLAYWDHLYGEDAHLENPEVWVIEFRKVAGPL